MVVAKLILPDFKQSKSKIPQDGIHLHKRAALEGCGSTKGGISCATPMQMSQMPYAV